MTFEERFPPPFERKLLPEERSEIIAQITAIRAWPISVRFGANNLKVDAATCFHEAADEVLLRARAFLASVVRTVAEQAGRLDTRAFVDGFASEFIEVIQHLEETVSDVGADLDGPTLKLVSSETTNDLRRSSGIKLDRVLTEAHREPQNGEEGCSVLAGSIDLLRHSPTSLAQIPPLLTYAPDEIRAWIRAVAALLNTTPAGLAKRAGLRPSTINRLFTSGRENDGLSTSTLAAIVAVAKSPMPASKPQALAS